MLINSLSFQHLLAWMREIIYEIKFVKNDINNYSYSIQMILIYLDELFDNMWEKEAGMGIRIQFGYEVMIHRWTYVHLYNITALKFKAKRKTDNVTVYCKFISMVKVNTHKTILKKRKIQKLLAGSLRNWSSNTDENKNP